jgi:L,D-transpeptidase ErfK/SrfK
MYPEDISTLFPVIKVGDQVMIVNQAVKVGWAGNSLYIEVHPPLENHPSDNLLDIALDLIEHANNDVLPVLDGAALRNALTEQQGMPIKIYERSSLQVDETNNTNAIN